MSGPKTKSTQILLTKGRGTLTEEPGNEWGRGLDRYPKAKAVKGTKIVL